MKDELQELRVGAHVHKALEGVIESLTAVRTEVRLMQSQLVELSPKIESVTAMRSDLRMVQSHLVELSPKIENISKQTTLTNGRVTRLELWRAKSTGVMIAISVMSSLIGWGIAQFIAVYKK